MVELTEILNEQDKKAILGRSISINPTEDYDRKTFVNATGDYLDLMNYYSKLEENKGDIGAMQDIAYLLHPKNPNLLLNRGTEGLLLAADKELSDSGVALAKYTEKNDLEDKLDEKQLGSVVVQLGNPDAPLLYKSDNEEHEKLAEIVRKQGLVQFGKKEELMKDIPYLMKDAPKWHQVIFNRYADDQTYIAEFLSSYASLIGKIFHREFGKEVEGDEGRKMTVLNRDKLHDFYQDNLEVVEDAIDDEDDQRKKDKIWDKSIKPIYLLTAQALYPSEKRNQKEKDAEKEETRKKERRAKGIRE